MLSCCCTSNAHRSRVSLRSTFNNCHVVFGYQHSFLHAQRACDCPCHCHIHACYQQTSTQPTLFDVNYTVTVINKLHLPPTLLMTPRTPPPVHCRGCGHKFSKNKHSFYLPDLHSAPLLGWSHRNFIKIFCVVKLQSPWVIVQHCFWDPMFSCFDTIPACNGQTDRQTCGNSIYCTVIVSCR